MSAGHDLSGRRALVTGASSGVGEAVARQLRAAGAQVAIAARRADRLQRLADEIGAVAQPADVGMSEACIALIESTVAALGGLDILVNNAGAHHRGDFATQSAEHLAAMVDVNLRAPVVLSRAALPHLRSAEHGAIVNVGSVAGRMPVPGSATYSATKAGLRTLTYALAEECRGTNVGVSVVSPGPIATDFILADIDAVTDLTFSQPMSTPEQIADLVLACIADGRVERTRPASTRVMTTLGSLFPALPRALRPALAAKGRRAKARYRRHD
ncbi:SDR family NAD(P)-dependent oxidoreductase [Salinisphaera hydrothermalis]|uniref:SDR family NAD(P)-dependent oxidoreductase n=1 Tax=Salinisphaera hydrothermalis TaxID=563188 RepID=UPI00333F1D3C